jgi:bifunctional DNA-binding transcriptional regulator/antitoxin component of YhaV-PrlF toxin-antitoxin module
MEVTVSSRGQIVLPPLLRARDKILTGQRFSVHRLRSGDYRLVRKGETGQDFVTWLRSCPEKDYLAARSFPDTTADVLK